MCHPNVRSRRRAACRRANPQSPIWSPRRNRRRLQPKLIRARSPRRVGALGRPYPQHHRGRRAQDRPDARAGVVMLTKSDLKLQESWKRKKRERGYAHGYILEVPKKRERGDARGYDDMADMSYLGLKRPPGLRATDFVQELERLALEWGDRRFAQCARALFKLGIVNKKGDQFTKKRGPHVTLLKESAKAYAVAKVQALMKDRGLSEWKACALVAEDLIWEAHSFEAAQLRRASRARKDP